MQAIVILLEKIIVTIASLTALSTNSAKTDEVFCIRLTAQKDRVTLALL